MAANRFVKYHEDSNLLVGDFIGTLTIGTLSVATLTVTTAFTTVEVNSSGAILVDVDLAEAVLVRKNGDAGDVFVVDTTNGRVGIGPTGSPNAALEIEENAGTIQALLITKSGGQQAAIFNQNANVVNVAFRGIGNTSTDVVQIEANALTSTGAGFDISLDSAAITSAQGINVDHTSTAITANFTGTMIQGNSTRTLTAAATRTDTGTAGTFSKTQTVNNGSGTFNDTGNVVGINYTGTQTSGTLNFTGHGLGITLSGAYSVTSKALFLDGGNIAFNTGRAIEAAAYEVGRDADGTNQLHFNVPTGAGFEFSANDTVLVTIAATGITTTQLASTSGAPTTVSITGGAHTGLTAATEVNGMILNFVNTKTWASGAGPLVNQREIFIQAPTYAGDAGGALTITDAATFYIDNAPTAGSNITLTNAYAFQIGNGAVHFSSTLTTQNAFIVSSDSITTGAVQFISSNNNAFTSGTLLQLEMDATGITADWTGIGLLTAITRTLTAAATRADSGVVSTARYSPTVNNGSGTFNSSVNVQNVSYIGTQTSGTLDWTGTLLNVTTSGAGVNSSAIGVNINMTHDGTVLQTSGGSTSYTWSLAGSSTERFLLTPTLTISSGTQSVSSEGVSSTHDFTGSSVSSGTIALSTQPSSILGELTWGSSGAATDIVGITGTASKSGTGTITIGYGLSGAFVLGNTTGTVTTAAGVNSNLVTTAAGTITNSYLYNSSINDTGGATFTNLFGLNIPALSVATTLAVGVDIGAVSGATTNHAIRTSTGPILAGDAIWFTQTDGNERIDSAADGFLDYTVTTAHRFNMSAADTDVRLEFIGTTSSGLLEWMEDEDHFRFGDDVLMNSSRFIEAQGADVASTTNLVLGSDGNAFELTGTTKVDLISNLSWQNGAIVTIIANESVTIDHGTTTSTTNITIRLAGAADFAMTAGDTLTLLLSETTAEGQAWRELARAAI